MATSLVEKCVADFQRRHPSAEVQTLSGGGFGIRVPDAVLDPAIWSKDQSAVAFVVPSAFPVQRPDCFWTDPDLRLKSGQLPANSGMGSQHPIYPGMLWFSYHPVAWDVRDTVETYWHLIQGRLLEPR
jgi:hypothetical protein